MVNGLNRERILKYLAYVLMGSLFIFLLKITWLKYGSLYVDTFRDPWIVDELSRGKVVYRDLFYEYGFFPPYILSGLCAIFGYHLNVFVYTGAVLTGFCAFFVYRICRLFTLHFVAVLVFIIFLVVFAFGQYQALVLPYSFATLFFILFSLAALFFLLRFILKGRISYLCLWAVLTSFIFLSRPIMGFLVYLGFLFPGLIISEKYPLCARRQVVTLFLLPMLFAVVTYWLFLMFTHAWGGFEESIVGQITTRFTGGDGGYAASSMGLGSPMLHLLVIVILSVEILVCVGLLVLAVKLFMRQRSFLLLLLCAAVSFIAGMSFLMNIDQYRPLPIMMFVLALWSARRAFTGKDEKKSVALCALFAVGFFMALRIVLNAKPMGGSFYFLTIALIGYYVFFFRLVGDFFAGNEKVFSRGIFSILLSIFFIITNSCYPVISWALVSQRTTFVGCERGALVCKDDDLTRMFEEAGVYLRNHTDKNATVTAIPEISGINFFSQRRNPLRYYSPAYGLFAILGEDAIMREFVAKYPDYVIILSSMQDKVFGVDYGFKLNSWINYNYQVEKIFGDYPYRGGRSGGIVILKKKSS